MTYSYYAMLSPLLVGAAAYGFVVAPPPATRGAPTNMATTARIGSIFAAESGGGQYSVGAGAWPSSPSVPKTTVAEAKARGDPVKLKGAQKVSKRGKAPHGKGRGRGRGRGSPVVSAVLNKIGRLGDDSASLEDVDAVLRGKHLTAREYTTVLTSLRKRRAWRVALLVGEWLRECSDERLAAFPNRAHYQAILSACAAGGATAAAEGVVVEMVARGFARDSSVLSSLILTHERARDPAPIASLLDELEAAVEAEAAAAEGGAAVEGGGEAGVLLPEETAAAAARRRRRRPQPPPKRAPTRRPTSLPARWR